MNQTTPLSPKHLPDKLFPNPDVARERARDRKKKGGGRRQ
jgi:hypothetical protein